MSAAASAVGRDDTGPVKRAGNWGRAVDECVVAHCKIECSDWVRLRKSGNTGKVLLAEFEDMVAHQEKLPWPICTDECESAATIS